MEAKDTVLPYLQVSNQIPMTLLNFIAKLEAQAQRTESMLKEQWKQEGIRDVERIMAPHYIENEQHIYVQNGWWIDDDILKAKLKEWGIKEV